MSLLLLSKVWFACKDLRLFYKRMMAARTAVQHTVQPIWLRLNITPLIITTSTHRQYYVVFQFVLSGKVNNMSRFVSIPRSTSKSAQPLLQAWRLAGRAFDSFGQR